MSVHGQVKIRTSAEQKAAKDRERKVKLDQYQLNCEKIFSQRYTSDPLDLLRQTQEILLQHPDCFTLWNIRRETIQRLNQDEQKQILEKELDITQLCLQSNPKSYSCWFQRQWVLKFFEQHFQLDFYQKELNLCKKYLEYDERNFHCWAYRFYLLEHLSSSSSIDLKQFYTDELSFLRSTIGLNQSNYSAWHYRTKYLEKDFQLNSSNRQEILSQEWKLLLSAIYTDCFDQAAWFYARWILFKQLDSNSIDYNEHIQPLEELDQIEPKNKWCMLILTQLWKGNENKVKQRLEYLHLLAEQIDPDRKQFYRDQI